MDEAQAAQVISLVLRWIPYSGPHTWGSKKA